MRLRKGCWNLLCKPKTLGMCMMPGAKNKSAFKISADAGFAPGGERSNTGVVVKLCGVVVHW
eukprot:3074845-Prorocentrum_lima.AAC.1